MFFFFHDRKMKKRIEKTVASCATGSKVFLNDVLLAVATCVLLLLFALFAANHGDILVSGKGDDGYFWRAVFSSEITGLESLYPNIALLRFLYYLGFDFISLCITNISLQVILLLLLLKCLQIKCIPNQYSHLWIFLWISTTFEVLYSTVFLMRDIYIILLVVLVSSISKFNWMKITALGALTLLRPFALLIIILFAPIKKIILVMLAIIIIYMSGLADLALKSLLMPNAIFSGERFKIEDVISARNERNLEGQNKMKGSLLALPIFAPALMIARPLVPTQGENEYLAHNGLTDVIEFRSNDDPYIMWQNMIIPINCIYLSFLVVSLFRGLISNTGNQRRNVLIYLVGTIVISIVSGQGRHHLMINWLEPVIIAHSLIKEDLMKVVIVSVVPFVISLYFAIQLLVL